MNRVEITSNYSTSLQHDFTSFENNSSRVHTSSPSSSKLSTIHILYFAMRFPELSATASSVRIYQLLESFKQLPYYLNHPTRDLIHEFHQKMNLKKTNDIHYCENDFKKDTNDSQTLPHTSLHVTFISPQSIHTIQAQQFYHDFRDQFTSFKLKTIESNDLSSMDEFLKEYIHCRTTHDTTTTIPTNHHHPILNICIFDTMISEEIYSFRARELLEPHHHTLFITDTQDLRSLRNFRMEQLRNDHSNRMSTFHSNHQQQYHQQQYQQQQQEPFVSINKPNATNELLLRELSSIYRSDLSLIVSRDEFKYLLHDYGIPKQKIAMASFFYSTPSSSGGCGDGGVHTTGHGSILGGCTSTSSSHGSDNNSRSSSSTNSISSNCGDTMNSNSNTCSNNTQHDHNDTNCNVSNEFYHDTSFHSRKHFMSIGNGNHPPNKDSINYLRYHVWPFIHSKLPTTECHIYGAYLDSSCIHSLTSKSLNFYVKGKMMNLNEMFKYRVNLAMLRAGAGIKGKIADGWMYGLPCVSTLIGYEGMNIDENDEMNMWSENVNHDHHDHHHHNNKSCHHGHIHTHWGGLIAHSLNEFISHAHSLYTNESLWKKASQQGYSILSQLFCKDTNTHQLLFDIKRVYEDKILLGMSYYSSPYNYVQHVLSLNQYRTSHYMAKYIHEKNKNIIEKRNDR
ncbi:hypothetical protein C9374_006745 [Naegleria lovaniensis]|uniref:Uncharacterized protein n=1 Tax=Naegleria lovaniensis TaxID=51637 RepID=A0AA88GNK8_NAELO|nr:uncharacterized protein C9374_006745 [Naegleria lovaniensis]KAG2379628.1 hypothetical protein C9374_006745 [Naegleria lovaniensis]